ncbi:MAG: hypothetical protein ABSD38_33570 [Syntrophorhabdales bacterium]
MNARPDPMNLFRIATLVKILIEVQHHLLTKTGMSMSAGMAMLVRGWRFMISPSTWLRDPFF